MINFLRENLHPIIKMFVNQICISVFGLMLAMATKSNSTLLLITSIFSIIFYVYLLYSMSWMLGAKDKISVDGGRLTDMPLKGLYMSLCANLINIVCLILMIIGFYSMPQAARTMILQHEDFTQEVLAQTPAWASWIYQISTAAFGFLNAMYAGALSVLAGGSPVFKVLTLIPTVFSCFFGYYMGDRDKHIIPQGAPQDKLKTPAEKKSWGNNLK